MHSMMKAKVRNAKEELFKPRLKYQSRMTYLNLKCGHHMTLVIRRFKTVMQEEVSTCWKEGNKRNEAKFKHLVNKWGKKSEAPVVGERGVWKGVRYGDEALQQWEEEKKRESNNGTEGEKKKLKIDNPSNMAM